MSDEKRYVKCEDCGRRLPGPQRKCDVCGGKMTYKVADSFYTPEGIIPRSFYDSSMRSTPELDETLRNSRTDNHSVLNKLNQAGQNFKSNNSSKKYSKQSHGNRGFSISSKAHNHRKTGLGREKIIEILKGAVILVIVVFLVVFFLRVDSAPDSDDSIYDDMGSIYTQVDETFESDSISAELSSIYTDEDYDDGKVRAYLYIDTKGNFINSVPYESFVEIYDGDEFHLFSDSTETFEYHRIFIIRS